MPSARNESSGASTDLVVDIRSRTARASNRRLASRPLPAPLTSFIGRTREIDLATSLLRGGTRLITVSGPPGIGKTRLAIEVGTALEDDFPDGVVWAPLARVADTSGICEALLESIDPASSETVASLGQIGSTLRDSRMLLVIDAAEHLTGLAEIVRELQEACPGLSILNASRTRLHLPGERLIRLDPLATPPDADSASPESVAASDAANLLIDRTRSIKPEFEATGANAGAIGEICRWSEGNPLAIELVADRLAYLTAVSLASTLGKRLPVLEGAGSDHSGRPRSMRDALRHSYSLLDDRAQALFRHAGIFSGGFRLDAVRELQACASDSGDTGADEQTPLAFDQLGALTDSSLMRQEIDPDGEPRYRMLETTRELALELLHGAGELHQAERARAAYLLRLAERFETAPYTPGGEKQLAVIDAERRNVQEALTWLCDAEERTLARRLAGLLAPSWYAQGRLDEGRAWLGRVLTLGGGCGGEDQARICMGLAHIVSLQGDLPLAGELFNRSVALYRNAGDPLRAAIGLIGVGITAEQQGDSSRARMVFAQAQELCDDIADKQLAASIAIASISSRGSVAHGERAFREAKALHLQALELSASTGYTLGVCRALADLGDVSRDEGDHEAALGRYRSVLEQSSSYREPRVTAGILTGVAGIAVAWGQMECAARMLGAASKVRDGAGIRALTRVNRTALERIEGAIRERLDPTEIERALAEGRGLTVAGAIGEIDALVFVAQFHPKQSPAATRYGLSRREVEVLTHLASRLTDREIAEQLHISPRTVGFHVASVLRKLGVSSRRQAAERAKSEELIR